MVQPTGMHQSDQRPDQRPDQRQVVVMKRRRRPRRHARHGGAWKVAYADFVTAMMAFFLLLWLLNVTTSDQRQGIADYFSPAGVSHAPSGSGGVLGGLTITVPGTLVSPGAPLAVPREAGARPAPGRDGEARLFAEVERKLLDALEGVPALAGIAGSIIVDRVPEGLRIQIVDQADRTMFPLGSARMYPQTREILDLVAQAVSPLPNRLSISGHTDGTRFARDDVYGNWELSTDRANASRRALVASGIGEDRIATVIGKADREPLLDDEPNSPRNRRISIVLLRERGVAGTPGEDRPTGP